MGLQTAMTGKSLYDVLGVTPDADDIVIRAAYRALMAKFHPDVNANGADRAREIVAAFGVLGRPESRAAYDLQRSVRQTSVRQTMSASAPATRSGPLARATPHRPTRRPVRMSFAWQGAGVAARVAPANQWLLPAIAMLVASTSLIATYSLVYGAELGVIDLAVPGEEGGSSPFGTAQTPRPVPSLTPAAPVAVAVPPDAEEVTVPGSSDEPLLVGDIVGAVKKFGQVRSRGGNAAVRKFSANCNRWARRANTLQAHDYCVAFDYAAQLGVDAGAVGSGESAASPYVLKMVEAPTGAGGSDSAFNRDPSGVRFATLRQIVERQLPSARQING